jgi:hypothetical protein
MNPFWDELRICWPLKCSREATPTKHLHEESRHDRYAAGFDERLQWS